MLVVTLAVFALIVVSVLFFVFQKLLTQNVSKATHHLDQMNQEFLKKEMELNRKLSDIEKRSGELIAKAQEEADLERSKILQDTAKEKEDIVSAARKEAEDLVSQAEKTKLLLLAEIEGRIKTESVKKAFELLQMSLPEDFKKYVHERWIEDLIDSGFEALGKHSIENNVMDVIIRSAFPLTNIQKQSVIKKIQSFVGKDKAIKEDVDPSIIAGLIVEVGSLVLDGSLKNRFQENVNTLTLERM